MSEADIHKAVADGAAFALSVELTKCLAATTLSSLVTHGETVTVVFTCRDVAEATLSARFVGNTACLLPYYGLMVIAVEARANEFGWGLHFTLSDGGPLRGFLLSATERRPDALPDFVVRTMGRTVTVGGDKNPYMWDIAYEPNQELVPHA